MLISFMTITSLRTEEAFTPTLMSPIWMADGVLKPSGFPTNSLESRPLPENGEMSAAPKRTSTLVISGPRVSTPFLTMEFSEKKTTTTASAMRTTMPRPMRRNNFFIKLTPFRRSHDKCKLQTARKAESRTCGGKIKFIFRVFKFCRRGKNFHAKSKRNFKKIENFWLEKNKNEPILVSVEGDTRPPRSLERKTNLPCHVRALNSRP